MYVGRFLWSSACQNLSGYQGTVYLYVATQCFGDLSFKQSVTKQEWQACATWTLSIDRLKLISVETVVLPATSQ